jgi:hypothetical protein
MDTEASVSQVYNPEAEIIAQIERLELDARDGRRRIEHARTVQDKRALNRQLEEIKREIAYLRTRLP